MSVLIDHIIYFKLRMKQLIKLLCIQLIFFNAVAVHGQSSEEYQVKAVFIYNLTNFVQWPSSTFAQDNAPLLIGVLGQNVFGSTLEDVVAGEKVDDHPLIVRYLVDPEQAAKCHIVFIERSYPSMRETLAMLKSKPVLTVSDGRHFLEMSGIIRMYTDDNRIRLEIHVKEAERSKLTISPKLLKLATLY